MTTPLQNQLLKVQLTQAAEDTGMIAVSGQVLDGAGQSANGVRHVLVRALGETDAKVTLTGTVGTELYAITPAKGPATAWLKTTTNGVFTVEVDQAEAGDRALLEVVVDGGVPAFLELVFAA